MDLDIIQQLAFALVFVRAHYSCCLGLSRFFFSVSWQHKLEGALLALGQFQHALDELLAWLTHTKGLLSEQKPVGGDPKAIEIELAKHHVLQNDVLAHQSTVEAVNKAGNDLIESSEGEEASSLQHKLRILNQRWQDILEKTDQRKRELDSALHQVTREEERVLKRCGCALLALRCRFNGDALKRGVKIIGIKNRADKEAVLQFLA